MSDNRPPDRPPQGPRADVPTGPRRRRRRGRERKSEARPQSPNPVAPKAGSLRNPRQGDRRTDAPRPEPRPPRDGARKSAVPPIVPLPPLREPQDDRFSSDRVNEPAQRASSAPEEQNPNPPALAFLDMPRAPEDPDQDEVFSDLEAGLPYESGLANVVGVRFKEVGRIYEYDAGDLTLMRGDLVMVAVERGTTMGTVAVPSQRRMTRSEAPLRPVVRRADANDEATRERQRVREDEFLTIAREQARQHKLAIKLFRAEFLGGNRILISFAAEDRPDIRELARDLQAKQRVRVEFRQFGVRDDAKAMGGIGSCGLELCCSTFLPSFAPVSIRMAKDQGLVLSPQKVSGQCGRLKCCLVYEEAQYREALKGLPKLGKRVQTPDGEGRVQELDVLRRRLRVSYMDGSSRSYEAHAIQLIAPERKGEKEEGDDASSRP